MSLCRVRGDSEGRLSTAQQASLRRFSESTGRVVTLGDACPHPRPAGKMAGLIGPPRSAASRGGEVRASLRPHSQEKRQGSHRVTEEVCISCSRSMVMSSSSCSSCTFEISSVCAMKGVQEE